MRSRANIYLFNDTTSVWLVMKTLQGCGCCWNFIYEVWSVSIG